jgi:hypothetical protein
MPNEIRVVMRAESIILKWIGNIYVESHYYQCLQNLKIMFCLQQDEILLSP